MGARSKARKRALDMLYSADVRSVQLAEVISSEAERAVNEPQREASWLYAREIVDGVMAHQTQIDEAIETHAQGWSIERMPAVDRAIVRCATWEILFNPAVDDAVAIDEAVELARELSTDDSPRFVNGLLAAIANSGASEPQSTD